MFGAFSKALLAETADFNFLECSFDEILLSWNMVSGFSEPTKAGICMRNHLLIFATIRGLGRGFCLILNKVEKKYCAAHMHAQRLWGDVTPVK